jgi:hypothetical protein
MQQSHTNQKMEGGVFDGKKMSEGKKISFCGLMGFIGQVPLLIWGSNNQNYCPNNNPLKRRAVNLPPP